MEVVFLLFLWQYIISSECLLWFRKRVDFHNRMCVYMIGSEWIAVSYAFHTIYIDYCTRFLCILYIFIIIKNYSLQIEDGPNSAEEDLSPARGNITFAPGTSVLIYNLTVLDDQVKTSWYFWFGCIDWLLFWRDFVYYVIKMLGLNRATSSAA